jgi:hypothetical protein
MRLKQLTELKRKHSSGHRDETSAQLPNNLTLWVTGDNSMRRTLALLTLLAVAALGIGCGSETANNSNTTTNTANTMNVSTPMSTPTPMSGNTSGGNMSGGNTSGGNMSGGNMSGGNMNKSGNGNMSGGNMNMTKPTNKNM